MVPIDHLMIDMSWKRLIFWKSGLLTFQRPSCDGTKGFLNNLCVVMSSGGLLAVALNLYMLILLTNQGLNKAEVNAC